MTDSSSSRVALPAAALLTILMAVGSDVVAGEGPVHTLVLGLIAAGVAVLRVRLAGRRSGLFAVVSGAVVAQPAFHAVAKVLHPWLGVGHHGDVAHSAPLITVVHLLLVAVIVAAVTLAEQLFVLLGSLVQRVWGRLLGSPAPAFAAPAACTVPMRPMPPPRVWVSYLARRGPPAGSALHAA